MQHLTTEQLIGYAEAGLPEQQMRLIQQHAQECRACNSELNHWVSMFALMQGFSLQSAPRDAVQRCRDIYGISKPVSRLREILATLVFDSFEQPLAAGVRGDADSRQLLLSADDLDLHVRISQTSNVILGQLLQRSDKRFVSGARIQIFWKNETVGTTVTDSLGEFRIQGLPEGELRLCADLAQVRLVADLPRIDN